MEEHIIPEEENNHQEEFVPELSSPSGEEQAAEYKTMTLSGMFENWFSRLCYLRNHGTRST